MRIAPGQTLGRILKQMADTLAERPLYKSWPEQERAVQTRFEAETLWMHITGMSRTQTVMSLGHPVQDASVCTRLEAAVASRLRGVPLAYVTGRIEFYGREFQVRPGCLIPRPETELLVESAAHWVTAHAPAAKVYELGCGSGIISISLALECPETSVQAVDVSADAIEIAKVNARRLGANVILRHTDGLDDVKKICLLPDKEKFQVLLSNPPYIPSEDIERLDDDVKNFEPLLALDGGEDGLFFYRTLLSMGDVMFIPNKPAAFFFEVGIGQADVLKRELTEQCYSGWGGWHFYVIQDLRGVDRVFCGERI